MLLILLLLLLYCRRASKFNKVHIIYTRIGSFNIHVHARTSRHAIIITYNIHTIYLRATMTTTIYFIRSALENRT